MEMEISFVIPAYNEEKTLGACVSSIRAEIDRTGHQAEIIVVNNASADRTHEVAAAMPGVRVIDEPRKGTNRARESGFEVSSGKLVATIDADSMLPPGWLDTVYTEFARDPKLVGLGGPYIYYDLSWFERFLTNLFQGGMFLAYLFNRFVLRSGSQLLGGNCVVRRSALRKIGGYDTRFAFYGDDLDTARRLMAEGHVKWTYHLPVFSSGRRFKQEGIWKTAWIYSLNFFSILYGRFVFSKTHVDARPSVMMVAENLPVENEQQA